MAEAKLIEAKQKVNTEKSFLSTGLIILIVLSVILALIYVRIKVEGVRLGYEISTNRKQNADLLKRHRILESEFMKLRSHEKLEAKALAKGFKYPTQNDIIYVEQSRVANKSQ